jgi:predicted nuclease with RNAse H fold
MGCVMADAAAAAAAVAAAVCEGVYSQAYFIRRHTKDAGFIYLMAFKKIEKLH